MGNKTDAPSESAMLQAPLLDIHAVAIALGITPRHVQRLVAERRIPFLKVGRFVRFDPAVLNVWLDEQRVEAVRSPLCCRTTGR
jgi:excisionase family DNA binding protein